MPPKKVYTKKDPIDHVLLRSSMYVGSKTLKTYDDYAACLTWYSANFLFLGSLGEY